MTNNNKYRGRSHDLSALDDDIDNMSDMQKQYADSRALQEAQALARKYEKTPTFLRLLAIKLNNVSKEMHDKHLEYKRETDPNRQAYEKLKREVTQEVYRDLGLSGDTE
ncbi:MAG TPA: hypothetical protein VGE97_02785 [Nitrososphaera sp.]|jgi:hypothetical protein